MPLGGREGGGGPTRERPCLFEAEVGKSSKFSPPISSSGKISKVSESRFYVLFGTEFLDNFNGGKGIVEEAARELLDVASPRRERIHKQHSNHRQRLPPLITVARPAAHLVRTQVMRDLECERGMPPSREPQPPAGRETGSLGWAWAWAWG